jgi:flavin-binding protein dodecin
MSVAKVTELSAESEVSFEDAVEQGVKRANDTLEQVKSAWVKEQSVNVEGDEVVAYRVKLKITFVLTD